MQEDQWRRFQNSRLPWVKSVKMSMHDTKVIISSPKDISRMGEDQREAEILVRLRLRPACSGVVLDFEVSSLRLRCICETAASRWRNCSEYLCKDWLDFTTQADLCLSGVCPRSSSCDIYLSRKDRRE